MDHHLHGTELRDAVGTVWAVFGHRFAIEGQDGRLLADLGPEGAEGIALKAGDAVAIRGEAKPSEIKVTSITLADGTVRNLDRTKRHRDDHADADPAAAIAAVTAAGYTDLSEPRRKPKHFEIAGSKEGSRFDVRVELDGTIRKAKAASWRRPTFDPGASDAVE